MPKTILLSVFAAMLLGAASPQPTVASKNTRIKQILRSTRMPSGVIIEYTQLNQWADVVPVGFEYTIDFDLGASKGLSNIQFDGTVFDVSAGIHNRVNYGHYALNFVNVASATGATPSAGATGLDIAGGAADTNNAGAWGGNLGASGRPLVVGTDPSASFCVTTIIADTSGNDAYFVGWRTMEAPVAFGSHADFCGFMVNDTTINVTDTTTGETDTTLNWADGESKELCILVSSSGVCTYTIDGTATAVDTHTIGDGLLVVPATLALMDATPGAIVLADWTVAWQ